MSWLERAQDHSRTVDGGVARHYSLVTGWASSYPETTGYIVPTFIDVAQRTGNERYLDRARRMLDWLAAIQFPEGGFQGGLVDSVPRVPVTFNTGQILLGLAAGTAAIGPAYSGPMHRAANWLVNTQDTDGCWRQHPTPFAAKGEKAYETHVAWGLLEAAKVSNERAYADAALRNVNWALAKQAGNGWFADCCLSDPVHPLTHTIGYVLRGINEAYAYTQDPQLLAAAQLTARALIDAQRSDGSLPGRLDAGWKGNGEWTCLTGTVQIAYCWLQLYRWTNDARYRDAAFRANRFVRLTMHSHGRPEARGAIKGSFPVDAEYGPYQFLNWAAKFFVDSNLLEQDVRNSAHAR
jgi:rhamnogalacturonyl hydrolase YesR